MEPAETYQDIPIDETLAAELESEGVLGGGHGDDEFFARAANQPIAFRLRSIFEKLNQPQPSQLGLYEMFEVWLVPHRVSIIRRRGAAEATSVGIQVEYIHNDTTCSIIALIPSSEFLHHGRLGLEGLLQGRVSATGEAGPRSDDLQFNKKSRLGELSMGVTAAGEMGFKFRADVMTPYVSAVGIGASNCEWRFDKQAEALFGKDIETWTVLALPKRQTKLAYRLRYYICTRTLFVPTRRQSGWFEITCALSP